MSCLLWVDNLNHSSILNVDLEYDCSYVYVHRSNNELVEINKDVDEIEEDAKNETNNDNGSLG